MAVGPGDEGRVEQLWDVVEAFSDMRPDTWGSAGCIELHGTLQRLVKAHALADAEAAARALWWSFDMSAAPRDGGEVILSNGLDVCAGFWSTADNRRTWADPAGNWFAEMDRGNEFGGKPLTGIVAWCRPTPPVLDAAVRRVAGVAEQERIDG